MFYCEKCDKELTQKEMTFVEQDNAFEHKNCGGWAIYTNKR